MTKVVDKLKVKKSWVEVTAREWMLIGEIGGDEDLKDLTLAKRMKTVAAISNRTEEQILEYSGENLANILAATAFLDVKPTKRKVKWFTLGRGKDAIKYMFHPKPDQLSGGEMVSIEQLMIDEKNTGRNTYADILTILIRPCSKVYNEEFKKDVWTVEKFTTENLNERKELFLDKLTVDKFFHEMAFFLSIGQKSKELFRSSIPHQKKGPNL